jgi:hypothetical protein
MSGREINLSYEGEINLINLSYEGEINSLVECNDIRVIKSYV